MRDYSLAALSILGFATVGITTVALSQAAPATSTAANQVPTFAPGFDDLMTMLVQPRHIRLYYAGTARNWELAAAELRDLRSSFDRLAQTIPNYLGNDVNAAVTSLIAPQMTAVEKTITSADPKEFTVAYGKLTDACNACHTYLEHPFIVIKNPDSAKDLVHSDQEFKAVP
jgi:hypothetical protein